MKAKKSTKHNPRGVSVMVVNEKGASNNWLVLYCGEVMFCAPKRQIDAVRYGRGLAVEKECEFKITSRTGRIRKSVSYGYDDPKIKG
jgi:hypothetical protein